MVGGFDRILSALDSSFEVSLLIGNKLSRHLLKKDYMYIVVLGNFIKLSVNFTRNSQKRIRPQRPSIIFFCYYVATKRCQI